MHQKRRLTFNGLHGVISQKIELFITTAVRTSNPAELLKFANLFTRCQHLLDTVTEESRINESSFTNAVMSHNRHPVVLFEHQETK
jgi:hypothetical protein